MNTAIGSIDKQEALKKLVDEATSIRKVDMTKAMELSEAALSIARELNNRNAEAKTLQNLGFCKQMQSNFTEAIEYLNEASRLFAELNDPGEQAATSNFLGKVYAQLGDYQQALDCCYYSLRISEDSNDAINLTNSLITVSILEVRLQQYNKAESLLLRAEKLSLDAGYKYGQALAKMNLGKVYGLKGDKERSLELFLSSLPLLEELDDRINLSNAYGNIAISARDMGDYQKARDFFNKACNMKAAIGDHYDNIQSTINLAQLDILEKKFEDADKRLNEAMERANSLNALPYMPEIHHSFYKLHKALGKTDLALSAFEKYHEKEKELHNEENKRRAATLEIKYKVDKIEKEKEIFRLRNVELAEAHKQILFQHDLLDQKNKDITDSLRYAKGIQQAILPSLSRLDKYFRENLLVYLPKDIVSGDFYWISEREDGIIVIVGDCTGHGVPGALMSMIANDILNQVVNERKLNHLPDILEEVDKGLKRSLTRDHSCNTDGMDLAMIYFKPEKNQVEFAGAKRPLWLGRGTEITEYGGTRRSLEAYINQFTPFEVQTIPLLPGDVIYLFTDGLPDQMGGSTYKKLKKEGVKKLLTTCLQQPLAKQRDFISNYLERFKGELEQVDDILLLGLKV